MLALLLVYFSPIRIFVYMRSGVHHGLAQTYLGSPVNRNKKLCVGPNKSEGNMLTRYHSQRVIPKINAFLCTRFFELPRKEICCASGPVTNFSGFHLCSYLQ